MKVSIEGDTKAMYKLYEQQGFWVAWGAAKLLGYLVLVGYALLYLSMAITPVDATDEGRFSRSGLKIVTDKATGCEYLISQHGGIVPRRPS